MLVDAFWCGGVAGAAGSIVTQPLDTVRIKMQTGAGAAAQASVARASSSSMGVSLTASHFRSVIAHEGMAGLYKGVMAPAAAAGPRSACIFAGYDTALRSFDGGRIRDHALAGVMGGLFAAPVTTPMELGKCRVQVSKMRAAGSSALGMEWQVCHQVWQREGFRGLACGISLTACRDALFRGTYFATFEVLARGMARVEGRDQQAPRPFHVSIVAGGLAGVLAWLPVYPLDVIKTHWQTGHRFNATTLPGLLRSGLATEGTQWLTRGLGPTLLRAAPLNAIVFTVYESLRTSRRR
jgi:solute carrier family 25 carnitine/acylcarnitine transporter 20/29